MKVREFLEAKEKELIAQIRRNEEPDEETDELNEEWDRLHQELAEVQFLMRVRQKYETGE